MKVFCSPFAQRFYTTIIGILLLGSLYFYAPPFSFSLLLIVIAFWIIFKELPQLANPQKINFWILASCYVSAPFYLAILLNQNPSTRPLFLLSLILCFGHDTAAYITGNLFGKHLLAPTISPNKTLQGCLGGFIGIIIVLFVFIKKPITVPFTYLLLIALALSLLCFAGDLFESFLKRKAGLKDTGCLLPGQGGLLDRFDSMLFVMPFMYIMQYLLTPIINKVIL